MLPEGVLTVVSDVDCPIISEALFELSFVQRFVMQTIFRTYGGKNVEAHVNGRASLQVGWAYRAAAMSAWLDELLSGGTRMREYARFG